MDTLKLARSYAGFGWQVFPLKPRDKVPFLPWADVATTDEKMITGWWDTQPDNNIAIATGARSGLVALDVDPGHGGEATLAALVAQHGPLPDTPQALTGGGGRHYLFAHPGVEIRNSAGLLGPGLDIRGDGGYIAAPGSTHPNGKLYRWDTAHLPSKTPLAQMPPWMVELLTARHVKPAPDAPPDESRIYVEGGRNQALTSLAGTMRRRGMSEGAILAALTEENQARCFPTLPDDEVENIAKSVSKYAPSAPPVTHPQVHSEPVTATDGLLELISSLEYPTRFILTGLISWDAKLGDGEAFTIAARPSVGKTTLSWQIARNVAAAGQKVLYLSLEMSRLALYRKAAFGIAEVSWIDYQNGRAPAGTKERIQTEIVPRLIDALDGNMIVYDGAADTPAVWRMMEEQRPDLVVIDHLARLTDKADTEVQRLGQLGKNLHNAAKALDCGLIVIHHINRASEKRIGTREPQLSDLRDSGHLEQDADVVVMPHRPDFYEISEGPKARYSETRLLIRKNREGESGFAIGMYFDTLQQWFYRKEDLPPGAMIPVKVRLP
jgi:hypothetical protein